MKALIAFSIAALAFSGAVVAEQFTPGTPVEAGNTGTKYDFQVTANKFVQNEFSFSLSALVALDAKETKSQLAVATASARGKNAFTGSTEGGSVTTCKPVDSSFNKSDLTAIIVLANNNGCSESSS